MNEPKSLDAPNFFILGAAKCGTTTLYHLLKQHPDIFLTEDKEPHFFSSESNYKKGITYYLKTYFNNVQGSLCIGEATPQYFHSGGIVAPRIKKDIGENVKFIIILRDPVERAWSHYLHMVRDNLEDVSFEQALENEAGQPVETNQLWKNYFSDGLYADQILKWLEYYPLDNFLFLFTDDLQKNQKNVVEKIITFLGLGQGNQLKLGIKANSGGTSRHEWLSVFLNNPNIITNMFKHALPHSLRQRIRLFLNFWNLKPFKNKPTMNTEVKNMLRSRYLPANKKLENIIGKDLSDWNTISAD